jgi:hypothetical protein
MTETVPKPDPAQNVHTYEHWDANWSHIRSDLARIDALPAGSPERQREEVAFLIAVTLHQERVLEILARESAPKPKRTYIRKAKVAEEPVNEQ